jgi:hypothetical protein
MAAARSGDALSFVLTAALIGGGYLAFKSSRKADVLAVDAAEARPTRHMVPLDARLDRAALARWLDAQPPPSQPPPPSQQQQGSRAEG